MNKELTICNNCKYFFVDSIALSGLKLLCTHPSLARGDEVVYNYVMGFSKWVDEDGDDINHHPYAHDINTKGNCNLYEKEDE